MTTPTYCEDIFSLFFKRTRAQVITGIYLFLDAQEKNVLREKKYKFPRPKMFRHQR